MKTLDGKEIAIQLGDRKTLVDETRFDEMLGAVPPARMAYNGFLVGEPVDHNSQGEPRYDFYFIDEDHGSGRCYYFGGVMTTSEFDVLPIDGHIHDYSPQLGSED